VAAPRAGYEVNWYRQNLDAELFITLPLFEPDNAGGIPPQPKGVLAFTFPQLPLFAILPPQQTPVDFEDIWPEESPTLTIPVSLFLKRWNDALTDARGRLSVLEDGRLTMSPINTLAGDSVALTVAPVSIPWWTALGFSTTGHFTNTDLIAQTIPISNMNLRTDELELIGTGPQLIDRENPCLLPNGPTAEPRWVDWRKEF
jgi:hypothetical protein